MAGPIYSPTLREALGSRDFYQRLRTALWSERASFDAHWRELADFFFPRRTRFWVGDRNRGDRRNQNIIDSTGRFAARTLQSGLHAGLTSPARPWFKLTTPDPELAERPAVKEWLHLVTRRMQILFASSNLYNTLPTVYGDMGVFGTAAMAVLPDEDDLFRCYAYPVGSYALAVDRRGLVRTFIREYELTVAQVVEEFGVIRGSRDIDWSRLSPTVKSLWDRGEYTQPIPITWVVCPNPYADETRLEARFKRFASCHFETGESRDGRFLRESGFDTFPILAPRWEVTGEDAYGTDSPGMTALGDVKQLQVMQREKGKAIKKQVDPPLKGSPELRTQKTSLVSGDITYVTDPAHNLAPVHEVHLNLADLTRDIAETQFRIERAFFVDLFLMLTADRQLGADRPTAREIEERHEEKLLALGPILERTNDELLDPLIDRVFDLMQREGLVPEPPEELEGVNLRVEYVSILAQAQKLVGVVGQDRFVAAVAPLAEAFPEVRHKVDPFRIVDNYADMLDVDPTIVRTDDEARARLEQDAQAQRAALAAEQLQTLARAAKDASQTPIGQDSALDRVLGGPVGSPPAVM